MRRFFETGSTAVVEATVTDNGVPIPNQSVTFSVAPATAGYFSPTSDTTDASGVAATVFTATTSGAVTITASVDGSSLNQTSGMTINDQAQVGSGNISIAVTPSLLLANGADTSRINITVRDASNQFAPESTLVKLVAGEKFDDIDGNGYFTNGVDTVIYDANANGTWDGIGIIPSTVYTIGTNGLASVDFISGYDATTVYIRATVDDQGITGFAETSLQLTPNSTVASIYLSSDSMQLAVKGTGGIESSILRATAYDINGNTVPEGITIDFRILDAPLGLDSVPAHLGNVGYGPFTATTNGQGMAISSIHSGTAAGTIRIRATSDTIMSAAAQVLVSAGPPAHVEVSAQYCNIDFWDDVAGVVVITATVADIYLNPVNDSTVVYFSTDEGTMKSHEIRTIEHEGIARTLWFSGHNSDTANGRVIIMAETAGGTVADTSMFFSTDPAATLTATGHDPTLRANGKDKTYTTVRAWDQNLNPVIGGTIVEARPSFLIAEGGTLEDGCGTAEDELTIISTTLDEDLSMPGGNDDGIGAYGTVRYSPKNSSASVTITIQLLTGVAYLGKSTLTAQGSAAPLETMAFSVEIVDRFGNPLGDHTLVLTTSDGTISPGTDTQETNAYGEANGFIWTAPNTTATTSTITITDTDPRGGIIMTKGIKID